MSVKQKDGFKDPSSLTKWTKFFLYAQIVVLVISIIFNMLEYQLLSDFSKGVYASQKLAMAAVEANDVRQEILGIIFLVIWPISAILIFKWIYRANYNVRQLGASGMRFTPGWSVGWFFIPITNLWKPYQVIKEIWKASSNPNDWDSEKVPSMLLWWWILFTISCVFGSASTRVYRQAEELIDFIISNVVTQISDIIAIPVFIFLIVIINRVHSMQMFYAKNKITRGPEILDDSFNNKYGDNKNVSITDQEITEMECTDETQPQNVCPFCNTKTEHFAQAVCMNCGRKLPYLVEEAHEKVIPMYCPFCGEKIHVDSIYCRYCGKKIEKND